MMASNTVIARIGLDDNGFQQGVTRIQRSLKLVQSEFAVASSKLGDFGNSTEGLRVKADSLSKQIDLQKQKVEALKRAYVQSVEQKGADAKATQNLQVRMNQATAELHKMENNLQSTTNELKIQTSNWTKLSTVLERTGTTMKTVGDKMSSVGTKLSTAVTLPLIGVGTAATKMAMDAVESENLFEVAMGSMADDARAWSEEISGVLGLNAYSVRQSVATYNAMLTSMGLTEQESLKFSESLTELAYDMASFYNLSPEEAFEKLKSGITGEAEPLKALGILVNDTTIKNYAYTHSIAEQGEELTEAQKVQARYGAIMEATANAQGDLARTMDSPTNQLRIMQEQVTQIAIQFGQILIPVLEQLIGIIKPLLDKFQGLSTEQQELIVKVGMLVAALGPVIGIVGKIISVAGTLHTMFGAISGVMATAGVSTTGFGAVIAAVTGPIGIAIAAITACVGAITLLYKHNEAFRDKVNAIWEGIKEMISSILDALSGLFDAFIEVASGLWQKYGEDISKITENVFTVIQTIIETVLTGIQQIIVIFTEVIKGNWEGVWQGIKDFTTTIWNAISSVITLWIDTIATVVKTKIDFMSNTIRTIWTGIKSITQSVWRDIKSAIENPIEAAKQTVKNVIDSIKNFFSNLRIPEIKIPHIKMPHFSLQGSFSLDPPSVPRLAVDWYAKGGIFNQPSIIGVGEAGQEAVLPIDRLDDLMASALLKTQAGSVTSGGALTVHIDNFINQTEKSIEQLAYELEFYRQRITVGRGGC